MLKGAVLYAKNLDRLIQFYHEIGCEQVNGSEGEFAIMAGPKQFQTAVHWHWDNCAQAGAQWSKDNLEMDKAQTLATMKDALETVAGQPLNPISAEAHRWRYALVDKPFAAAYLASHDQRLFAIGDGMLGGRVEAAFESARQLCDHLRNETS